MCLGIPGRIVEIFGGEEILSRSAKVNFGGVIREISLAAVPNAEIGEYVVVHAGLALTRLKQEEADEVFSYLGEKLPKSRVKGEN
ncbi:MAG: HypC/HybG/HupF family hydrogenase formation chaperone [Candidatus Sabulitectum sp.]|nr:HypC/HybG/HupF family hydrogenase formation chaperone [Candidatus Sabulitectum sp.]